MYDKFKNLVDIVIDSGFTGNQPSTIIDCTKSDFETIRQGKGNIIF